MNIKLKGVDVSHHNGTINWAKAKADGIKFAIIKAGNSNTSLDPQFHNNIKNCIKNGIPVGIYWFSYAISVGAAKREAIKCIETLRPYKNHIVYPVFWDFEYASADYCKKKGVRPTGTLITNMGNAFLEEIEKAGYTGGIYTNVDYANNYFSTSILKKYELWIAQYSAKCTYKKASVSIWQYSENGEDNGISGIIDMDYSFKDYSKGKTIGNEYFLSQEVKELQHALNNSYKIKLDEDGSCGSKTVQDIKEHALKKGVSNEHVKWLQQMLVKLKYGLVIDGIYGEKTEATVKKYQKKHGLKEDGIVIEITTKNILKRLQELNKLTPIK